MRCGCVDGGEGCSYCRGMSFLLPYLRRRCSALEDYIFEKKGGFNFGGLVKREHLDTPYAEGFRYAGGYQAARCSDLRHLFKAAGVPGRTFPIFIDLGSGKGKAVFYARAKGLSQEYIGVELSTSLVGIANQNLSKSGAADIRFELGDAGAYVLPEAACFIFLFNPFDAAVMAKFLSLNRAHFERFPSVIAYAYDVQREVFAAHGFEMVFRDPARKISLHELRAAHTGL